MESFEVGADWTDAPRSTGDLLKFQYDNLQATDGTPIDSRTKHREYMKANGLAMADDFKETWAKKQAERETIRQVAETGRPTFEGVKARREDVGRAAYQLQTRRRK